jgi:hypothetical protein
MARSLPEAGRAFEHMNTVLLDHFRCPESIVEFSLSDELSDSSGYFRVGKDLIGYGRLASKLCTANQRRDLVDCAPLIHVDPGQVALPFDAGQVIDNLRFESYVGHTREDVTYLGAHPWIRELYYVGRPFLPIHVRRALQRLWLRNGRWTARLIDSSNC